MTAAQKLSGHAVAILAEVRRRGCSVLNDREPCLELEAAGLVRITSRREVYHYELGESLDAWTVVRA